MADEHQLGAPLDVVAIARVLAAHRVEYIVVGGIAAIVHGYSGATFDADTVPAIGRENLERLSLALEELDARSLAVSNDQVCAEIPQPLLDATHLGERLTWHFATIAGRLDVLFLIDGVGGYSELVANAVLIDVEGVRISVASLDDLIASKETTGRAKDLRALDELRRLRERPSRS